MKTRITTRDLTHLDCMVIPIAFAIQGWNKPSSQYHHYLELQKKGIRDVIVAEWNGEFAGYLTILWEPRYPPFQKKRIPEVVDFNVLKKFQRKGIGTALMDEAEKRIRKVSSFAGIGFGITEDYGAAQILYIKRGYIPLGKGLVKNGQSLSHGENIEINDDVVFYLIKDLGHRVVDLRAAPVCCSVYKISF